MATYYLRQQQSGDYYWILKSNRNNKIVAMSSEAYETKQGAKNSIIWTKNNAKDANYKDSTV
jgi:uncharacterized protein YegP (UPF0339 family)